MDQEFPTKLFFSLPIELQSLILSHQPIPHFKDLVSPRLYHTYSVYFRQFILEYDPTITLTLSNDHLYRLFEQYGYLFDSDDWYANYWNWIEIQERLPTLRSPEYQQALTWIRQLTDFTLYLSGLNLLYLPPIIGQLTQLQVLYLSRNHLTSLPETIGQLIQLQEFSLAYNHLTSLPETMGQLTQLQRLALNDNRLTSLPMTMSQLTRLQLLSLSNNHLTSLPTTIDQLTRLNYLSLYDNPLIRLPESISQLTQLHKLSLDSSQYSLVPHNLRSKVNSFVRADLRYEP